jgi:hypothetical protein
MTRDELTRLRNVSIAPNAIDPIWLRQAVREIDQLRSDLEGMCRLYEESERRYREREAQLALRRVNARRSF